jgi:hypothetical protein
VSALVVIGVLSGILSFSVTNVSVSTYNDPVSFIVEVLIFMVLAGIVGWWVGEAFEYDVVKGGKIESKKPVLSGLGPLAAMVFFGLFVFHMGGIVPPVSAASLCITEQMQPVTDIMTWAGIDLVPAVIVLIIALIPLIFIMMGVKFAGGILADVLGMFSEIKNFFKFN